MLFFGDLVKSRFIGWNPVFNQIIWGLHLSTMFLKGLYLLFWFAHHPRQVRHPMSPMKSSFAKQITKGMEFIFTSKLHAIFNFIQWRPCS